MIYHLGNSFEVIGYLKPNADLDIITSTAREEINNLTKNDVLMYAGAVGILGNMVPQKGVIISHNLLPAEHKCDYECST